MYNEHIWVAKSTMDISVTLARNPQNSNKFKCAKQKKTVGQWPISSQIKKIPRTVQGSRHQALDWCFQALQKRSVDLFVGLNTNKKTENLQMSNWNPQDPLPLLSCSYRRASWHYATNLQPCAKLRFTIQCCYSIVGIETMLGTKALVLQAQDSL